MTRYDYLMCPCCGIGHGRNVLKDPEPVWLHCDACTKHHQIERAPNRALKPHPKVAWAWADHS